MLAIVSTMGGMSSKWTVSGHLPTAGVGPYLREQRLRAQLSLRQLADLAGVSNPYLSQVERGLRKPSAEVLQQLARALSISSEALYVQAGILDQKRSVPSVTDAILADQDLSRRQRRVLLELYRTFLVENSENVSHNSTNQSSTENSSAADGPVGDQSWCADTDTSDREENRKSHTVDAEVSFSQ